MEYIPIADALDGAQLREQAVREASTVFDDDIAQLRELYSFSTNPDDWPAAFANRLAAQNKEYRQSIKQDLHAGAHNLKYLYGDGGDSDTETTSRAMNALVTMVIGALKAKNRMKAQLAEFDGLHKTLVELGLLTLPDRIFIRKSLPDLELCLNHLERDANTVKADFNTHKQSFYVIAFEHELKKCQEIMRARRVTKDYIENRMRPVFTLLSALQNERASLVEESAQIGLNHGLMWFALDSGRVSLDDYNQELKKYDDLAARIAAQCIPHDESLRLIDEISESVMRTPQTLPGPDGIEIPVKTICDAFKAYERLCTTCSQMLQVREPLDLTMRNLCIVPIVLALCALMVPWCALFVPYATFRFYVYGNQWRLEEPHVSASLESVFRMSISMQCELVSAFVHFPCDLPENPGAVLPSFDQLRIAQRFFIDEAVRLSPPPQACLELQAFVRVVHTSAPSTQNGTWDAHALLEIDRISREACYSLAALLQHIELALCRVAFLYDTALLGLMWTDRMHGPSRLHPLIGLTVNAIRNSASFALTEVDRTLSLTSSLLSWSEPGEVLLGLDARSQASLSLADRHLEAQRSAEVRTIIAQLIALREHLHAGLELESDNVDSPRLLVELPLQVIRSLLRSTRDTLRLQVAYIARKRHVVETLRLSNLD
ncbi:hypothetical protein GY45DRAFT_1264732 [Cubamyces sp. BRFM 1775]|nr:hypothetical protein GY45DRAFT_1264732 [Cubamyces sp. BRFM 1775]